MNKISVFDIDGTLFPYGNDLFFTTMAKLVDDISIVEQFFSGGKTIMAAEAALSYCKNKLEAAYGDRFDKVLEDEGAANCKTLFDAGEYYQDGFNSIQNALMMGHDVYLSTANVDPIVRGVLRVLKETGLLCDKVKLLSSTWHQGTLFANIAENKIASLEGATGKPVSALNVTFYCDDITGNDRGLAEKASLTYVIDGTHNKDDDLPVNAVRVFWKKHT